MLNDVLPNGRTILLPAKVARALIEQDTSRSVSTMSFSKDEIISIKTISFIMG